MDQDFGATFLELGVYLVSMPLIRVTIFVGDVQKCARFYSEAFGFAIVPSEHSATEWAELDTGGCRLALHKAHGPDGPIDAPTGSAMNPHKIVFFAEDVEAVCTAVAAHGGVMRAVQKYGAVVRCDGQDPEGHVFQITNCR